MLIRSMLTTVLLVAAGLPSLAGAADAPTTSPDSEPVFSATVSTVPEDYRDRMIGVSWKPGCPVPIDDLRIIDMNYWGFDGSVHDGGLLMVHKDVVDEVVAAFGDMFAADFPIRLVEPEGGITGRIEEGSGIDWFELHLGVMVEGQPVDLVPALVRLIASGEATELIAAEAEETADDAPVLLPLPDGRLLPLPARQVVPILAALVELFAGRTGAEGEGAGGRFGFMHTTGKSAQDLAGDHARVTACSHQRAF